MDFSNSQFLYEAQTAKYFSVSGLVLWVFNYYITFEYEVHWVWGRRWDYTRVIFTCARYLPLVGVVMPVYGLENLPGNCYGTVYNMTSEAVYIVGIVFAEGLLVLRTFAFWQGNKTLLVLLLVYALVSVVAGVVLTLQIHNPYAYSSGACKFTNDKTGAIQFAFLTAYQCLLLFLTTLKMFRHYHSTKSVMIITLYRDGIMYMCCIIATTVTNIVVHVTFPAGDNHSLDSLQLVLHSVLASRIFFNLRESDARVHANELPLSTVSVTRTERFATRTRAGSDVAIS